MNNIYAEADEILRTGNKKAIVSLYLQMQLNFLRAEEAERKLGMAKTEIERLKNKENEDDELLQKCLDLFEEQVERSEGLECRYFKKGITDE